MTLDPTDNLIVQRGSDLGTIEVQNMSTIQNNDLLVVGRGSESYKITGLDFKNSIAGDVELEGSAVVTPTQPTIDDTLTCVASAAGGTQPYTFDYQWFYKLDGSYNYQEVPGATNDTLVLDAADEGYCFKCHVTVTGANGGTLELISNSTEKVINEAIAPIIGSVSLVESNPNADPRFTSQEFVTSVSMAENGLPDSVKTIDAYVEGSVTTQVQFKEPLESFANQSGETWSDALTSSVGSFSSPATNAFDGDFNTRCIAATSSTGGSAVLTWTLTQAAADLLNASTGLLWYQVKGDGTASGSSCAVYRNTIEAGNLLASAAANNVFPLNLYGGGVINNWVAGDKLISTGWNGQGGGDLLYGISVDNNLMKDGEPEVKALNFAAGTDMTSLEAGDDVTQTVDGFDEPLQNYVTQQTPVYADRNRFTHVAGSGGNGFNFGYQDGNIAKGFDGIENNNTGGFLQGQYPNVNPNTEKWWYTFPSPIVSPGKVEVFWKVATDNSKQHYLIINEATTSVDMTAWAINQGQGTSATGWQDITQYINDAGGTLRSLGMQTRTVNQPTRSENWSAIRVDGKILISDATESSLEFAGGTNMGLLTAGTEVTQPGNQFSAALESSAAGTQPTYNGIQIISATAGFLTGGKNTPFNGNVNDFTQISGQGSGNTIEWDMLELANQGFDCRGKELEIYMGSNASNAQDMRCQFWAADFNSQIAPWVQLPLNNAYFSMGVIPEDANIGILRFYPNNVSSRATCYHIKIGGIHVYNSGPYYPALTFPAGTEMGGLTAGDEVEQNATTGTVASVTNTTVQLNNSSGTWTNGETVTGPEKQPKGTVESISGTTATLSTDTGGWVNGVNVTGPAVVINGTVGSIDGTTVKLSSGDTNWVNGVDVTGPQKDITIDNTKKYLKFDSDGNVSDLLSAPQDPQYLTTDENPELTFKFPSTFPSGKTPDEELGEGTTLTVDAYAFNTAGSTGHVQATVQPEGSSGGGGDTLGGLTTLYSGDSSIQNIVNGIDLANGDGLVWIKNRGPGTSWHELYDTKRGAKNVLYSNDNSGQSANNIGLTGFLDNGFQVGSNGGVNASGSNYVAWTFQKAAGYFDVITQTLGVSPETITHNLGTKPGLIIGKKLDSDTNWLCWHKVLNSNEFLILNTNNATQSIGLSLYYDVTTDEFKYNPGAADGAGDYVFYVFAENTTDMIKCDTYSGVGSGNTVTTGFAPQWVMMKRTDVSSNWMIYDKKRINGDRSTSVLYPNVEVAEQTEGVVIWGNDGFQLGAGEANLAGGTYVYVAIAEPTTRSLTQEEFNEQAIKFGTYDHRKHVNCARLSEENRDALIQYFADQGYSLQDILTYL